MRDFLDTLVTGGSLDEPQARELLDEMTRPDLDPVLAAAVLTALRMKGETPEEIRGVAGRLRELAVSPGIPGDSGAVDIVGTGGDGSGSLNLSTGAALAAAAAGAPVVKHGNRSVSSRSGSADVLSSLGLDLGAGPAEAAEMFEQTGFAFLFAPSYHPAMASVAPVRRALGMRTIFNVAGPLANPAAPPYAVVGAYSLDMARTMAETLTGMGLERAFVIHGALGWDEPTPIGPYHLFEVGEGRVSHTVEDPVELGFQRCRAADLQGGDADHNADRLRAVFEGEPGPHRDALVLGASLALRVTGLDGREAVERAMDAIDSGRCRELLGAIEGRVGV